jgi:CRP-like cAMP-binding protein
LLHEGDDSRHVLLILEGWVTVSTSTSRGDALILALRGADDVVGDLAAFDGRPRSATITALDEVRLVALTGERFREQLTTHPAVAETYIAILGGRLRDADAERRALVSATVLQRVARLLLELAELHGVPTPEGIAIAPVLSQRDLAASVGATREAVAKALRVLRERDVVATRPRRLIVVQPRLLALLSDH